MDFFFNIGAAVLLAQMCPHYQVDLPAVRAEAVQAHIGKVDLNSDPRVKKGMLKAIVFVTMMNDSGVKPYPCDAILASTRKSPEMAGWRNLLAHKQQH